MNSLFWITLVVSMIGFVFLALIKKYMESKKNTTLQSTILFIVGTTVWGVVSIIFLVWGFSR